MRQPLLRKKDGNRSSESGVVLSVAKLSPTVDRTPRGEIHFANRVHFFDGGHDRYSNSHIQVACADAARGCTANRSPIALRMADKLLSAGLPFGESVR